MVYARFYFVFFFQRGQRAFLRVCARIKFHLLPFSYMYIYISRDPAPAVNVRDSASRVRRERGPWSDLCPFMFFSPSHAPHTKFPRSDMPTRGSHVLCACGRRLRCAIIKYRDGGHKSCNACASRLGLTPNQVKQPTVPNPTRTWEHVNQARSEDLLLRLPTFAHSSLTLLRASSCSKSPS